ncbi:MAG: signal peptidase I [Planctomycetota bacterium]|nr:signal peptidase I [Planctomycetota bacterium]
MWDMVRSVIGYVVVLALIVGAGKFYKTQTKAIIDPNDHSMEALEYPNGSYRLNIKLTKVEDLKGGETPDVVAYWVPGKAGVHRVARVVAIAGETIELERKSAAEGKGVVVKVNNVPMPRFKLDYSEWRFPKITVPRGCVFLLADTPSNAEDSMTVGPVPFSTIMGKLN